MAPRAIAAYARQSVAEQTLLFIEGGKFAYALTLCFSVVVLGLPFIHWWQHGLQDVAYRLLAVLMPGESLPMSQWLTYSVLLGENRQKVLGFLAIAEGAISFPLIMALMLKSGMAGVCVALALTGFLVRGVVPWLYGCRLIGVRPRAYVRRVFVPVTIAASLRIAVLYAASAAVAPVTFRGIFLVGAGYSVLYAATLGWALLGYSRIKTFVLSLSPQPEQSR
jgi:hypothetical protein